MIDSAEDPELILQQVIRDMRDKVPQMNNNVAQVMANENCSCARLINSRRRLPNWTAK